MDLIDMDTQTGLRLLISFVIGAGIGFEREYHSKAAGLRTMIMICLGSTMFTMISHSFGGDSPDRVASNIITGIGFLGAGVIFKDGLTISGITTATTIWITAALGMAVGAGEYFMAMAGSVIVILVLSALQQITAQIEKLHQARIYRITCARDEKLIADLENEISALGLKAGRRRDFKDNDRLILFYEIRGREKKLDEFNTFLQNTPRVTAFEF
jgi:putative Mg2+ transporter-C (MgtC) family protein